MNNNTIIVFDFETGGLDTNTTEPIEIAAIALSPRDLSPIPGGRFYSLCKPTNWSIVSDDALRINGKTREMLQQAPDQSVVWPQFVNFIKQYNPKKNSYMTAPIAGGKNIRNFDIPIFDRLCKQYGFVDGKGIPNVFHRRKIYDLEDFIELWFENSSELQDQKMDTLRQYFGMSTEKAHEAMMDTVQTAQLIIRFLQLHRATSGRVAFRNSCKELPKALAELL
jgi:DNA polymerase-3 subunit epsilon